MDQQTIDILETGAAASHAGTASFGELVRTYANAGIESYRVDYRERRTTFFLASGESHAIALPTHEPAIGDGFEADAIVEAIRGSQRGAVKYPEFVARSSAAGCVGYVVWIAGRHVTYFGRRGETHVERFPQASS